MRIAVTGTHGSGKSTLIDDFVSAHPAYESVPEPYWLLAQEGVPFAEGPNSADLEEQLKQSCKLILDHASGRNVIFDRCPLDFLAYLDVVSQDEGFEWVPDGKLLARIGKALATLDWLVFVPLLQADDIKVGIEYPALRARRRPAAQGPCCAGMIRACSKAGRVYSRFRGLARRASRRSRRRWVERRAAGGLPPGASPSCVILGNRGRRRRLQPQAEHEGNQRRIDEDDR